MNTNTICPTASPPQIARPRLIQRNSRWVQIGWDLLDCDGGFPLISYVVEFKRTPHYYSYSNAGEVMNLNFTIRGLSPSTSYYVRVGRKSSASSSISYSLTLTVSTLVAGINITDWLSLCVVAYSQFPSLPLLLPYHHNLWYIICRSWCPKISITESRLQLRGVCNMEATSSTNWDHHSLQSVCWDCRVLKWGSWCGGSSKRYSCEGEPLDTYT